MTKEQIRYEFMQNMLHPRKLPFTVIMEDLSGSEFMLMASFLTYEKENGRHITVNELASIVGVTLPAVSRSLKRLEERKLIKRETNEECRRNTFVKILPKGQELFEKNKERFEYMLDRVLNVLPLEEIEMMISIHKKIAEIISA